MNLLVPFPFEDNRGKKLIGSTGIDDFCVLTASERYRVAYCHPDIVCKVFLEGIDELIANTSAIEINSWVTRSKAQRRAKLVKIDVANVAHQAQAEMSGQVLELAPNDGFDGEDFPDFEKVRESGPLHDKLNTDSNNWVQPSCSKTMLCSTDPKSKKRPRSEGEEDEQEEHANEEGTKLGNNVSANVEVSDVRSDPPPHAVKVFHPSFFKGKDELVQVTDICIRNKMVATSVLDCITLAKDKKLYYSLTASRVQSHQDQLLYER